MNPIDRYEIHWLRRVKRADGFRVWEIPVAEGRLTNAYGFTARGTPLVGPYLWAEAAAAALNYNLQQRNLPGKFFPRFAP